MRIFPKRVKYPEYFIVDFDVFVKFNQIGKNIVATNHLGNPYSIGKAIVEGYRVTKKEYLHELKKFMLES